MKNGIPVLTVSGMTIPEAWEKAVMAVWEKGIDIKTEYDKEGEPESRDCTMIIVVEEPMSEPRIHRAFPGGLEDLEVYRQEVVLGVHDHWISPDEGKWTYTYHKRLFEYETGTSVVDQMDYIITKLSETPHSRRGQAITWNVGRDPSTDDPPCLQRIWCRITPAGDGRLVLNMNSHWRSRDAYKASFMNIFALTDLAGMIARRISERTGKEVSVGRYVDIADSFHIYGAYKNDFESFLRLIGSRSFEERTWHTKFAEPFFEKARRRLEEERRGIREARNVER